MKTLLLKYFTLFIFFTTSFLFASWVNLPVVSSDKFTANKVILVLSINPGTPGVDPATGVITETNGNKTFIMQVDAQDSNGNSTCPNSSDINFTLQAEILNTGADYAELTPNADFNNDKFDIDFAKMKCETHIEKTFTILGDGDDEKNEKFAIRLFEENDEDTSNAQRVSDGSGDIQYPSAGITKTITIKNDDFLPDLTVTPSIARDEGDSTHTFSVPAFTLSENAQQDVNITYVLQSNGDANSSDVIFETRYATIGQGFSTANVEYQVLGDYTPEPNETFLMKVTNVTNAKSNPNNIQSTITIKNDDYALKANLQDANFTEGPGPNEHHNVTYTIHLDKNAGRGANGIISLDYSFSDSSRTGGTVDIPAGQNEANITLSITSDWLIRSNRVFTIKVTNASSRQNIDLDTANNGNTATITIVDDDYVTSIHNADRTFKEGGSGIQGDSDIHGNFARFYSKDNQGQAKKTNAPLLVTYDIIANPSGTHPATASTDFISSTGNTLIFRTGQTSLRIPGGTSSNSTLKIKGDDDYEDNETFIIRITDVQVIKKNNDTTLLTASDGLVVAQPSIGTSDGIITIQNDDDPLILTLVPITTPIKELEDDHDVQLIAKINRPVSGVTKIYCTTTDGEATAGNDFIGRNNYLCGTIDPQQTSTEINVTIMGDASPEIDSNFDIYEDFNVSIKAKNGARTVSADPITLIIQDDDYVPEIKLTEVTFNEGDNNVSLGNYLISMEHGLEVTRDFNLTYYFTTYAGNTATPNNLTIPDANTPEHFYLSASTGTIQFFRGDFNKTATIKIHGDIDLDDVKKNDLLLTVSSPNDGTEVNITMDKANIIIREDDTVSLIISTESNTSTTSTSTTTTTDGNTTTTTVVSTPEGNTTTSVLTTPDGNTTTVTTPDGNSTTTTTGPDGNTTSTTVGPDGNTTSTTVTSPDGNSTTTTSGPDGNTTTTTVTSSDGNTTSTTVGPDGNTTSTTVTSPDGNSTTTTSGPDGNTTTTTVTSSDGNTTTTVETPDGNTTTTITPTDGNTTDGNATTANYIDFNNTLTPIIETDVTEGITTYADLGIYVSEHIIKFKYEIRSTSPNADAAGTNDINFFGTEYTATLPIGSHTLPIDINVTGDLNKEDNKTYNLVLTKWCNEDESHCETLTNHFTYHGILVDDDYVPNLIAFNNNDNRLGLNIGWNQFDEGNNEHNVTFILNDVLDKAAKYDVTIEYDILLGGSTRATYTEGGSNIGPATSADVKIGIMTTTITHDKKDATVHVTIKGNQLGESPRREYFRIQPQSAYYDANTSNIVPIDMNTTDETKLAYIVIVDDDSKFTITSLPNKTYAETDADHNVSYTFGASSPASVATDINCTFKVRSDIDANITANNITDFIAYSKMVHINAGEQNITLPLPIVADYRPENNETLYLTVTGDEFSDITVLPAIITITDDDVLPIITIADLNITENDDNHTIVHFELNSSVDLKADMNISYQMISGSATSPEDYVEMNSSFIFSGNRDSATIDLNITGDRISEPDEYFTLRFYNYGTYLSFDHNESNITILDDDNVSISINPSANNVTEGRGTAWNIPVRDEVNATFAIDLGKCVAEDIAIHWQTRNGTAEDNDSDYQNSNGDFNIPGTSEDNCTKITIINVPIYGDWKFEDNETFYIDLTVTTQQAFHFGNDHATVTINNDDDPDGTVQFTIHGASVTEGDTGLTPVPAYIEADRCPKHSAINVYWKVSETNPISAIFNTDYEVPHTPSQPANAGGVLFHKNSCTHRHYIGNKLKIKGDVDFENTENFNLDINSLTIIDTLSTQTANVRVGHSVVHILDDDNETLEPTNLDFFRHKRINIKGDVIVIGNSVLEPATGTSIPTTLSNDEQNLTYVNVVPSAGIFNSSSAKIITGKNGVDINNSKIVWARVYWQGYIHNDDRDSGADTQFAGLRDSTDANGSKITDFLTDPSKNTVKLSIDGGATFIDVTPTNVQYERKQNMGGGYFSYTYGAYGDVTLPANTSAVQEYIVANIPCRTGITNDTSRTSGLPSNMGSHINDGLGNYGAWALALIYDNQANDAEQVRNVSVYGGYEVVDVGTTVDINITGFQTPRDENASVESSFTIFAGEGDRGETGDYIKMTSKTVTNKLLSINGDTNNSFKSSIDTRGGITMTPTLSITHGADIHTVDIGNDHNHLNAATNSILNINQNNVQIELGTVGDIYTPSLATFSTELFVPKLCYDYALEIGHGAIINGDNTRTFDLNGYGDNDVSIHLLIRSLTSDFDLVKTSVKVDVTTIPSSDPTLGLETLHGVEVAKRDNLSAYVDATKIPGTNYYSIGTGSSTTGGTIASSQSTYMKWNYDHTDLKKYTWNAEINTSIDFKSGGIVPYTFSTDSTNPKNLIKKCINTVQPYNPVRIKFNVERTDSNNYASVEAQRLPLFTQTIGQDFNLSLVNYLDNNSSSYYGLSETTLEVELIRADIFTNKSDLKFDAICENPGIRLGDDSIFTTFSPSGTTPLDSRVDFTVYSPQNATTLRAAAALVPEPIHLLTADKALRNTALRIWYFSKVEDNGTRTILKHNCPRDSADNTGLSGALASSCFRNFYAAHYNIDQNGENGIDTGGTCVNDCYVTGSYTSDGCYNCLKNNFAKAVCSRDNFAIRPDNLIVKINDANSSGGGAAIEVANNDVNNSVVIASGYDYPIAVKAPTLGTNTNASGYTRFFKASETIVSAGDDSTQAELHLDGIVAFKKDNTNVACRDNSHKVFDLKVINGTTFGNTQTILHNNIGDYELAVADHNWTAVDQKGNPLKPDYFTGTQIDDCLQTTAKPEHLANGGNINNNQVGCYISSIVSETNPSDEHYKHIAVTFNPYAFAMTSVTYTHPYNAPNDDVIFMQDLGNTLTDLNMSMRFDTSITAIGANNIRNTNFVFGCVDTNLTMDVNATYTVANDTNQTHITDYLGDAVEYQYYVTNTNTNTQYNKTTQDQNFSYAPENFKKEQNGTAIVTLNHNIKRGYHTPINPIKATMQHIHVIQDTVNIRANKLQDFHAIGGQNSIAATSKLFYATVEFDRGADEQTIRVYDNNFTTGTTLKVFSSYGDNTGFDLNETLSPARPNWYPINNFNKTTLFDATKDTDTFTTNHIKMNTPTVTTDSNSISDVHVNETAHNLTYKWVGSNDAKNSHTSKMFITPKYYLRYNKDKFTYTNGEIFINLNFAPTGGWVGEGKTGKTVNTDVFLKTGNAKRKNW